MIYFVILSAGKGERLGLGQNKGLVKLAGKTLLEWNVDKILSSNLADKVLVTTNQKSVTEVQNVLKKYPEVAEPIIITGDQRQDSCNSALEFVKGNYNPKPQDTIIFHNVANPFFAVEDLKELIKVVEKNKVATLAQKCKDTIRKVSENSTELIKRDNLWQMQTPQALNWQVATTSFEKAYQDGYYGTDDVELAERLGYKVAIVECSDENFKITTQKDLKLAELNVNSKNMIRVGIGQDSHRFSSDVNKPLTLGGIVVKNHPGLDGNSDADVILHSIFNAISQALGKRSVGIYSDPMCLEQGITDSREYLKVAQKMMQDEGYTINNLGIMIECKTPKIEPIHDEMKASLVNILNIDEAQIGITATSGEGLTDFGRGLGVQCLTTITLTKN